MKKTINHRIFKLANMLLFSCFFAIIGGSAVMADEPIDHIEVYSNIYNASSAINTEFIYEIIPDESNPAGATNEPTSLSIVFDNVEPHGSKASVSGEISFADVRYKTYDVYKYIVKEVSSSNPDYKVSSEQYEIYVLNANDGLYVYQQAKKLDDDTKGDMNFNHEPDYSYFTVNLNVSGDEIDRQEYFRFRVFIDTSCVGCSYDVFGQDEYVLYNGEWVKTSNNYIAFNRNGSSTPVQYAVQKKDQKKTTMRYAVSNNTTADRRNATYVASDSPNYIYMKHGQSVTIGLGADGDFQIPIGTLVKIIGDDNLSSRKWTMYIDGVETNELEHYVGSKTDFDILLERNMVVPNTGILAEGWPYMLLTIVGIVGLFVLVKVKASNAR